MHDERLDFLDPDSPWISVCCGAPPLGEMESGICSKCRDNTTFEREDDEEKS